MRKELGRERETTGRGAHHGEYRFWYSGSSAEILLYQAPRKENAGLSRQDDGEDVLGAE